MTFTLQIYTFVLIILCISSNIFVYIRKGLYICFIINHKQLEIMTVKEGRELVKILRQEIKENKDVELNTKWIECLNKSILKAIEKGYARAMKQLI